MNFVTLYCRCVCVCVGGATLCTNLCICMCGLFIMQNCDYRWIFHHL